MVLTLRMVDGLTMPEIARAFLVRESTMGQRIIRAKAKIKANRAIQLGTRGRPPTSLAAATSCGEEEVLSVPGPHCVRCSAGLSFRLLALGP